MNKAKQSIELEYKFTVLDKRALVSLLDKKYSKKKNRQYQSSVMFDNPSGLMKVTDGRIRVRTLGEDGKKTLTYKRPLPPKDEAKREIEYEIKFYDKSGNIEKILEAMEFTPSSSYERYQTSWEAGEAHITLDEYPYGVFIEIEGPKDKIERVASELSFSLEDGLTKPADTLFQEWRKERGLPFKPHMNFTDYGK